MEIIPNLRTISTRFLYGIFLTFIFIVCAANSFASMVVSSELRISWAVRHAAF